jgi:hypothetical protein
MAGVSDLPAVQATTGEAALWGQKYRGNRAEELAAGLARGLPFYAFPGAEQRILYTMPSRR